MKQITTLCIALVAVLTLSLTSCSKASQLKSLVEDMNSECPKSIGEGMTVKQVLLTQHDVVFDIEQDDDEMPVSLINMIIKKDSGKKQQLKRLQSCGDADIAEAITLCKQTKNGIRVVFLGKSSHEKAVLEAESTDL